MSKKIKHIIVFLIGIIFAIGVDQWSKVLVVDRLKGNSPYVLINQVFELYYSENRGAAFGMMQGKQSFFLLVVILVIAAVVFFMYRMPTDKRYVPLEICLALITSGAIGNMIDRVRQGYVVDFLYFKLINFPIFNVADCYVTIATGLLMLLLLFVYSEEELSVFSWKKHS